MNGLFDAPRKLKGLSISQVVPEDADDAGEYAPQWLRNVKGTRLHPEKLSLVANVLGYNHNHSPSPVTFNSGYLLTVIPPKSLQSKSNNSKQFSRGILIPLQPSLPAMRAAIAREFNLPSSGGLVVYLVENMSQDSEDPDNYIDYPGPLINDESWNLLWKSHLRSPFFSERMPDKIPNDHPRATPSLKIPSTHQSIAGKIEFDFDTDSKAGNWYRSWHYPNLQIPLADGKRKFKLRSDSKSVRGTHNTHDTQGTRETRDTQKITQEIFLDNKDTAQEISFNTQDSSQVPTPAAPSNPTLDTNTNDKNESPRSTSSLPYRTFELETLHSLLNPHSGDSSPTQSISQQTNNDQNPDENQDKNQNRGSVHVMQDTLDELEKALTELSPKPINLQEDFGQRRDAVQKAARTLSKIGNRDGFHMPRKDDGTLKSFEEISDENEINEKVKEKEEENCTTQQTQHGTINAPKNTTVNTVGSRQGYRKDDEPVDLPKSPSRSMESRSNSLSNSDDSNQNDTLTETPATETDMSRHTPPPKPSFKPHLSIETNPHPQAHPQHPLFSITPSSPWSTGPKTAPPNSTNISPPRSGFNLPKTPTSADENRSTKTSLTFGGRRKESIQMDKADKVEKMEKVDRKNSTESKRSISSKEALGLDGLGIKGFKFWSSAKGSAGNNSNSSTSANQAPPAPKQRERAPSITMPMGVVKTASGGPGRITQTYSHQPVPANTSMSMRSISPTLSSQDHGTDATTSMIDHFPDSRYPKDIELSDGKHMVPLRPPPVRQNYVDGAQTARTHSWSSSTKARGFRARKQSLDNGVGPPTLPNQHSVVHSYSYSHSTPLPSTATFAPPEPIPENLEEIKRDSEAEAAEAAEEEKINEILAKEREKDFEAKVEAFEQDQLASQARARALTYQEETRKAIKKEEEQEPELVSKKKGMPGSRFSLSPPPSASRKLPNVPVFSRRR
ncbi:hypothetical protein E3P98_03022 [Wallemia ichthyophaga]|nr:hypothetical protein E3P98_03022 [Wallemia ichthyophaga]